MVEITDAIAVFGLLLVYAGLIQNANWNRRNFMKEIAYNLTSIYSQAWRELRNKKLSKAERAARLEEVFNQFEIFCFHYNHYLLDRNLTRTMLSEFFLDFYYGVFVSNKELVIGTSTSKNIYKEIEDARRDMQRFVTKEHASLLDNVSYFMFCIVMRAHEFVWGWFKPYI